MGSWLVGAADPARLVRTWLLRAGARLVMDGRTPLGGMASPSIPYGGQSCQFALVTKQSISESKGSDASIGHPSQSRYRPASQLRLSGSAAVTFDAAFCWEMSAFPRCECPSSPSLVAPPRSRPGHQGRPASVPTRLVPIASHHLHHMLCSMANLFSESLEVRVLRRDLFPRHDGGHIAGQGAGDRQPDAS